MKTFTHVQAAEALKKGAVGIIPTDTVYGVVCSALHPQALERLYAIKKRHPNKAYIVLISALDDVAQFTTLSHKIQTLLTQVWPGPVSVVLPTKTQHWRTSIAEMHLLPSAYPRTLPCKHCSKSAGLWQPLALILKACLQLRQLQRPMHILKTMLIFM